MVGYYFVLVFLLVGIAAVAVIGYVAWSLRNKKYDNANKILKKLPFLSDSRGFLNPSLVAYVALRAKDVGHAEKIIDSLGAHSGLAVIDMLHVSLAAIRQDWVQVDLDLNALEARDIAEGLDITPLKDLRRYAETRDVDSLLSFYVIRGFGVIDSPLHRANVKS